MWVVYPGREVALWAAPITLGGKFDFRPGLLPVWNLWDLFEISGSNKKLWIWTPGRRKHLVTFSHFGGSVLSCAKSEVLILAPLIIMRVHRAFEI